MFNCSKFQHLVPYEQKCFLNFHKVSCRNKIIEILHLLNFPEYMYHKRSLTIANNIVRDIIYAQPIMEITDAHICVSLYN